MKHKLNKVPINRSRQVSASTDMRSMVAGRPTQVEADINCRAYQFYLERGCGTGRELEDWLRAEQELMHQGIHTLAM